MSHERFDGALLGLAIGDALGTTVEFKERGTFEPLTGIVGGGPFHLEPGQWTDDTSMSLCLADSLLESGGMDLRDQAERYVRWWREGYNSVNGKCFDIGNTVRSALANFSISGEACSGSTDPYSAGNGSIMRLAPVPMFFANDPARAVEASVESSRTTHQAAEVLGACRYFGALIVGALHGLSKEDLLSPEFFSEFTELENCDLPPAIEKLTKGNYVEKNEYAISGSGYVVKSLEAALWAFQTTDSFEEGALRAVNLGDDADTTGAVFGQLAGAYYGSSGIPRPWLAVLAWRVRIRDLATQLHEAAHEPISS